MTRKEAIKMLKAKLECMTRDVSGTDDNCNRKKCDECELNYTQGNMGEQKEWLRMAIQALEQEPCEDAISELKGLLKDHRHNFAKNSHEMRAWKLGIEDCIDVLYAINETHGKGTETHACVCEDGE